MFAVASFQSVVAGMVALVLLVVIVYGPLSRWSKRRRAGSVLLQLPIASHAKVRARKAPILVLAAILVPVTGEMAGQALKAVLWKGWEDSPFSWGLEFAILFVAWLCYAGAETALTESRRDQMRWLGVTTPALSIAMVSLTAFYLHRVGVFESANSTTIAAWTSAYVLFVLYSLLRIWRAFAMTVIAT